MDDHIKVGDLRPRAQYLADGGQTVFPYPFPVFAVGDLRVFQDDGEVSSGFAVTGAGQSAGGEVVFEAPPPEGARITLLRDLPIARTTDFQEGGHFRARVINDELDRLTMAVQQVAEVAGRALKPAVTAPDLTDPVLPPPQGGRVLAWDAQGQGLVNRAAEDFHGPTGPEGPPGEMSGVNNLAELTDVAAARANLGLGDAALRSVGDGLDQVPTNADLQAVPAAVQERLDFLEINLALNTLRDIIEAGWTVQAMIDGIADEYGDESGIDPALTDQAAYDAEGRFYASLLDGRPVPLDAGVLFGDMESSSHVLPNAFDDDEDTMARAPNGQATGHIGKTWDAPRLIRSVHLTSSKWGGFLYDTNDTNVTIRLEGSDDGETWTVLESVSVAEGGMGQTTAELVYDGQETFLRHRIFMTDGGGGSNPGQYGYALSKVAFTEDQVPADMTLASVAFAAEAPPVEARAVVLWEDLTGAADLAQDLVFEVSRDDGATWTPVTLADEGAFDPLVRVLSGACALDETPSATSVRYRVRTFNTRAMRVHGTWLQWRA